MKSVAIIPARMSSSRLPGKPLIDINGKTLIQRVVEKVIKSKAVDQFILATCDHEIKKHIESLKLNIEIVMTSKLHTRASDRCAEAIQKYELKTRKKFDIVIMIQGDEPLIHHKTIEQSLKPFISKKIKNVQVTNLIYKLSEIDEIKDINCVKVIKNKLGEAIYFSRYPIPYQFSSSHKLYKQVPVIAFKRNILRKFIKLKSTPLEIAESIDMLRFVENKIPVHLVTTNYESIAVDTKNDLQKVKNFLKSNNLE